MEKYSDEKNVPVVKSLEHLIDELHAVFEEDCVNVEYVKALLRSYKSKSNDWKKYVNFDAYRYTRNLVNEGNGKFNLMILCWGEGHGSNIHDHSDAHCFVKILAGSLKETLYEHPAHCLKSSSEEPVGQPLKLRETRNYPKDGVTYINDSLGLHRMENPSHSDRAITLHLYSPPFGSCNLFDERTGQKRPALMTFWSRYGQLELSDTEFHECSQVRPLRGLLSKVGC